MFGKLFNRDKSDTAKARQSPTRLPENLPKTFVGLQEMGFHHTQALQQGASAWGMGRADSFAVDLEAGVMTFEFPDKVATMPVQLIGTWAGDSGTFLWGWDHPMCPPADNKAASAVKAYADLHDIRELQVRKIEIDAEDGWQLAGIAALIGDLQGVYRAPSGDTDVYLGFGKVTLSGR